WPERWRSGMPTFRRPGKHPAVVGGWHPAGQAMGLLSPVDNNIEDTTSQARLTTAMSSKTAYPRCSEAVPLLSAHIDKGVAERREPEPNFDPAGKRRSLGVGSRHDGLALGRHSSSRRDRTLYSLLAQESPGSPGRQGDLETLGRSSRLVHEAQAAFPIA